MAAGRSAIAGGGRGRAQPRPSTHLADGGALGDPCDEGDAHEGIAPLRSLGQRARLADERRRAGGPSAVPTHELVLSPQR